MLDPEEKDSEGMPLTCRALFIIGPDKKMKLSMLYPASTGRSFDEVIRVIDSLQLVSKRKVATPADWQVRLVDLFNYKSLLTKTCWPQKAVVSADSNRNYAFSAW